MKIIRINTDNSVDVLEYPDVRLDKVMDELCEMLGENCEIAEHVMPHRLYDVLKASPKPTINKGEAVSMLVDEDGFRHMLPINLIGSWLYESDLHGSPIVGNVLIIGEYLKPGIGLEFSGLSNENFHHLYEEFKKLSEKAGVKKNVV